MGRKPRFHRPGGFYHVIARGNNGQEIFFTDRDRYRMCLLIQEGLERFDHRVHGFCFMDNHVHMIVQSGTVAISSFMHHITSSYARYFNRTHNRIGHLFQNRFKAILVDEENYLIRLIRYVHLNPVRAGIVREPEEYIWSSHNVYSGSADIAWISQEWILRKFDQHDLDARNMYLAYIKRGLGENIGNEFPAGLHQGPILGDDNFIERVCLETQNKKKIGKISIADFLFAIAELTNVSPSSMQSRTRSSELALARGVAALVIREIPHLSLTELARHLEKDRDALSRLAKTVSVKAKTDAELANLLEQSRKRLTHTPQ